MPKKIQKNGTIELLRFVFCISVLLYHLAQDYQVDQSKFGPVLSFFSHGRSGVEFFFLLSGFFMAKKVYNSRNDNIPVGISSVQFLYGKFARVFPEYLISVLLTVAYLLILTDSPATVILDKLPSLFFLQKTGISTSAFIAASWYISSMLIAMAIIYPFLKANYDVTARACAPVLSLLLMGYLIENYGALPNRSHFTIINPGNLRAIAVILAGIATFELSQLIKKKNLLKIFGYRAVLVNILCWMLSLYYIVSAASSKYDGYFVLITAFAIALTMAQDSQPQIFNNRFVFFLGEMTLSVYLCQTAVRSTAHYIFSGMDLSIKVKLAVTALAVCIVGIAAHYLAIIMMRGFRTWYSNLSQKHQA